MKLVCDYSCFVVVVFVCLFLFIYLFVCFNVISVFSLFTQIVS